ncbi:MAG: AsnC family transcriptional regulator [Deltaproteobacteria bacterium]|nr:AsnC family transcriptional regulator [Deltaproteobacteria bacterium]
MDDIDRDILNTIQSGFPVKPRPFMEIGKSLDLTEKEVIARIKRLKTDGIIRRIGGNFVSKKLGFTSTLCAAKVPENKIEEFVKKVNSYKGVTHNYLRSHDYNIWFTFIAPSMDDINLSLQEISATTNVREILNLPAVNIFKIKVDFTV